MKKLSKEELIELQELQKIFDKNLPLHKREELLKIFEAKYGYNPNYGKPLTH